jgi:hypothetical protein
LLTVTELARRLVPPIAGLSLLASWWLSLIVLIDSPLLDLTPPKIVVLVGAVVLLVARPWRGHGLRYWLPLVPLALYLGWFSAAAVIRLTPVDLKTTLAYLVFCGAAAAVAYGAAMLAPGRTARVVIVVVLAALAVSFAAAALERATYPLPNESDPLAWLWSIFRPQAGLDDPRLGFIEAPPLHSGTGEPGVVRATAFFVQTNFLAFFCVLAVPLAVVMFVTYLRAGRRTPAMLSGLALAAALVTAYWTYARVGLVAVLATIAAALAVEWLAAPERRRLRPSMSQLAPSLAGLGLAFVVASGAVVTDDVGLIRLAGSTLGEEPGVTDGAPTPGDIESRAARSAQIRFELQRTAVEMLTQAPGTFVAGTGMAAYETAVHDPASPRHIPEAVGIRDPNSMWLTVALAGGIVGVGLLIVLLGSLLLRLFRPLSGWRRLAVLWLAAWLPVWAAVQALGTNPFNTGEAIIFGTVVGLICGITADKAGVERTVDLDQSQDADQPGSGERSGDVDQA